MIIMLNFFYFVFEKSPLQYFICVISHKWIASETQVAFSFCYLILAEKDPTPIKILDLQPLPVNPLRTSKYEDLYNFKFFFQFNLKFLIHYIIQIISVFLNASTSSEKNDLC
ncbi:unnamed protein product [Rotaria sp. Silwood1]|nr:unnamed protein product [Rotaria sp. Silwood1]